MTNQLQALPGEARYEIGHQEAAELFAHLTSRYATFIKENISRGVSKVVIAVEGSDPLANLGRILEQTVFDEEAGDHSVEMMHAEYGPYENRSIFFLGVDLARNEVNGCVRIVTAVAGFGPMAKTMDDCLHIEGYQDLGVVGLDHKQARRDGVTIDLREHNFDWHDPRAGLIGRHRNPPGHRLDRQFLEAYHAMAPGEPIFDMATAVVPKRVRTDEKLTMSLLLYASAWRAARMLNVEHGVTFIRSDLLGLWRDLLGMPWEDLGGLGSTQYVEGDPFVSQPAYISYQRLEQILERERLHAEIERDQKLGAPFDHFVKLMTDPQQAKLFLLA